MEAAMAETVLVTGGSGFVGGWCIAELLKRGYAVRTTVRSLARADGVRAACAKADGSAYAEASADERLQFAVADLTADTGWDAAVAGCDFVLHVASPLGEAADRDAFLKPARDGTLRVLAAAVKAGVKRVVMTSAAATARVPKGSSAVSDETVWADPDDPRFDAYRRSKIVAERAAWDFMRGKGTEFATVLPGAVFGPVLSKEAMSSVRIIGGLLRGAPPRLPRLGFWIVDVRDLAGLHVRAMTAPDAAGERFIGTGDFMWFAYVAKALRDGLGPRAAKVPVREMPDLLVRAVALFNPQLRGLVPELGRRNPVTSDKARRMLGFAPRPAVETIVDCGESFLRG
jgi:dihydroflavonol-4-reductase